MSLYEEARRLRASVNEQFPESAGKVEASPHRESASPRAKLLSTLDKALDAQADDEVARLAREQRSGGGGRGGTQSGTGGATGGGVIRSIIGGLKRLGEWLSKGGRAVAKWLPWIGVATAKTEGEALFAVALVYACGSNPIVGALCVAYGLGELTGGPLELNEWKRWSTVLPSIEFPPTEERAGPAYSIAYEGLPPEPGSTAPPTPTTQRESTVEPPVRSTLKMRPESRRNAKPLRPPLSITKSLNE